MVWSGKLKEKLTDGAMLSEISPLSLMGIVDCLIALPFWPWKEAVSVRQHTVKHFFSNGWLQFLEASKRTENGLDKEM